MEKPYLVQRAKFSKDERLSKKGIDRILDFDYMGSSEFEDGSLFRSLTRIREDLKDYEYFQYTFKKNSDKVVTVFSKKENQDVICFILEQLADREIRLKEYCDLDAYIKGDEHYRNNDFWWDIDNDWMFWKSNAEFEAKFKIAVIK